MAPAPFDLAKRVSPGAVRGVAPDVVYVSDWRVARELTRRLPAGTSLPARHLYSHLAGHLNRAGECWPSIECLADESGMHPGTVRKARGELERAGLIVTIEGGGNRPNLYRLVDYRLSTPRAHGAGSPRANSARPRANSAPTPRPRRDEEGEEDVEETRARACPPWIDAGVTAADWALRKMGQV